MSRTLALSTMLLCALAAGCGPDEDTRLFDEDGVWTLTQFDLGGQGLTAVDNNTRKDAFLIKFDAKRRIAAAAACGNNGNHTVTSSLCKSLPEEAREWECVCMRYDYDESNMTAIVFPNDGPVPPKPASGATGETGGDNVAVDIFLAENESISNSYIFFPLPKGVFGSDGESSRYVFQQRSESIFDSSGCEEVCFVD